MRLPMLPGWFSIEHTEHIDGEDFDITIDVDLIDGRCRIRRLEITSNVSAISSSMLRSLPLTSIVATKAVSELRWMSTEEDMADDVKLAAAIYQVAFAAGLPPSRCVSDRMKIPYGTAKKRVAQARERGLLPPTRPGCAKG